jgi:copper chaperone NosL
MPHTTGNDGAADASRPDDDRSGGVNDGEAARAPFFARAGLAVLGVLLVAAGWFLPLWTATLHAPQYPGGLVTIAYGSKVTGDLNEINALNHYVGLGVFDPSEIPEMRLWPLALALAVVAVAVAALLGRGWLRRGALAYLWGMPIGVLAVIQFRLHEFGQDVEPGAAFHMEPFTPWVIGRTTVWNFETWSWPGFGLLALLAAAVVVTFGPRWFQRQRRGATPPSGDGSGAEGGVDRGRTTAVALLVAVLAASGTGLATGPAEAADHGDHDHGGHDHVEHDHEADAPDRDRAPTIGPEWHPAMPTIVDHPPAGDLADLLAEVEPGGTLHLEPGTYTGPVVIDEPVTIEGHGLPIIQGDGTGSVITIRAPGTVLRGLVVQGSGPGPQDSPAAIRVEADDVVIEGNVVQDSYMGLAVDSVASVKLIDNHVHGRLDAPLADDGHAVEHDAGDDTPTSDDPHAGHHDHDHDAHDHDARARARGPRARGPRARGPRRPRSRRARGPRRARRSRRARRPHRPRDTELGLGSGAG